jgi:hypothetical protein
MIDCVRERPIWGRKADIALFRFYPNQRLVDFRLEPFAPTSNGRLAFGESPKVGHGNLKTKGLGLPKFGGRVACAHVQPARGKGGAVSLLRTTLPTMVLGL